MPPPFAAHRLRVAMLIVVASMILFLGFSFYHCVSHPPVPPHLHKAAVVELAREWLEFASHCGIFFWIDYGSLLAAVRDKGEMMPWDHDADFSMLYSDVPLAMQHAAYFANRGITLSLHPTPRAGLRLTKHHIYIDIFGFDQDPEAAAFLTRSGRWHTIWGSPGPKENFPWYFVQPPLVNVTFEGMVFPAPHNAGELDETLTNEPCFLDYRYRNWRERPDANAQTSDSGVAFIRERVCDASAAQWGFVLWVLIALLVFLLRPMTGTWTRYTQLDQLDHEL